MCNYFPPLTRTNEPCVTMQRKHCFLQRQEATHSPTARRRAHYDDIRSSQLKYRFSATYQQSLHGSAATDTGRDIMHNHRFQSGVTPWRMHCQGSVRLCVQLSLSFQFTSEDRVVQLIMEGNNNGLEKHVPGEFALYCSVHLLREVIVLACTTVTHHPLVSHTCHR